MLDSASELDVYCCYRHRRGVLARYLASRPVRDYCLAKTLGKA